MRKNVKNVYRGQVKNKENGINEGFTSLSPKETIPLTRKRVRDFLEGGKYSESIISWCSSEAHSTGDIKSLVEIVNLVWGSDLQSRQKHYLIQGVLQEIITVDHSLSRTFTLPDSDQIEQFIKNYDHVSYSRMEEKIDWFKALLVITRCDHSPILGIRDDFRDIVIDRYLKLLERVLDLSVREVDNWLYELTSSDVALLNSVIRNPKDNLDVLGEKQANKISNWLNRLEKRSKGDDNFFTKWVSLNEFLYDGVEYRISKELYLGVPQLTEMLLELDEELDEISNIDDYLAIRGLLSDPSEEEEDKLEEDSY